MPGQEVWVSQKRAIDFDDLTAQKTSLANSDGETALTWPSGLDYMRTRTGRRGFLTFVGNSTDAGGANYITFHVKINGNRIAVPPLDSFTQAMGETYNGWAQWIHKIEIPAGAHVQVTAENSDAGNSYGVYARLRFEYEEF